MCSLFVCLGPVRKLPQKKGFFCISKLPECTFFYLHDLTFYKAQQLSIGTIPEWTVINSLEINPNMDIIFTISKIKYDLYNRLVQMVHFYTSGTTGTSNLWLRTRVKMWHFFSFTKYVEKSIFFTYLVDHFSYAKVQSNATLLLMKLIYFKM